MKRASEWFREKKTLIIVAALIALLILVVYLFFGGNSASGDAVRSSEEVRLASILESIDGVGDADVMITEHDGVIAWVVVVCEGADRILVKNDILNAVSTALDINKNIIAIYSK